MEENTQNALAATQAQAELLKKSLADLSTVLLQLETSQKVMSKSISAFGRCYHHNILKLKICAFKSFDYIYQ